MDNSPTPPQVGGGGLIIDRCISSMLDSGKVSSNEETTHCNLVK